ncbi:type IV pilin N-terminal domain-containing protein [Methanosarcina sp. Mfa9]|uniref:type IV pilin N-terminal domain-containing protein n=1 Tax=Methanosarcina sp. Mfa9 TaxID=3439063 RepID=UPI003F846883
MEGNKKRKKLAQDCLAVSEIIGAVLMIAIVVLAFSAISLAVFSEGGAMDPPHTPHTNLQENIDTSKDKVQIFHSGGESIELEDITIILEVGGEQAEFDVSDPAFEVFNPKGNLSNDDIFMLGDYIEIDPRSKLNITDEDPINFYFVHTASSQVIQKTVLWGGLGDLPYWITPHPDGSISNSTGEDLDTYLVHEINDGYYTEEDAIKNEWIYENFTFGLDAEDLDIPENTSFAEVLLKIVYRVHDNSANLKLEIHNGSQWTTIDDPVPFYNTFSECDTELEPYHITKYVNTTELEMLKVKISGYGIAANESKKIVDVDFIGIHLEY